MSTYFAVKYPDGGYLGYGWTRHTSFGPNKAFKYNTRLQAMKSASIACLEEPVVVRIKEKPRCSQCGKR